MCVEGGVGTKKEPARASLAPVLFVVARYQFGLSSLGLECVEVLACSRDFLYSTTFVYSVPDTSSVNYC